VAGRVLPGTVDQLAVAQLVDRLVSARLRIEPRTRIIPACAINGWIRLLPHLSVVKIYVWKTFRPPPVVREMNKI
jgi:hypothetical protein